MLWCPELILIRGSYKSKCDPRVILSLSLYVISCSSPWVNKGKGAIVRPAFLFEDSVSKTGHDINVFVKYLTSSLQWVTKTNWYTFSLRHFFLWFFRMYFSWISSFINNYSFLVSVLISCSGFWPINNGSPGVNPCIITFFQYTDSHRLSFSRWSDLVSSLYLQ